MGADDWKAMFAGASTTENIQKQMKEEVSEPKKEAKDAVKEVKPDKAQES